MNKIIVLNPFTIDPDEHAQKHSIIFEDESLTRQSEVEQSDINNIVKQFGLTKQLPYGNAVPFYDDISNIPTDYHTAQQVIETLDSSFMELPAEMRYEFKNDPQNLLMFLNDDSNRQKAIQLGLIPQEMKAEGENPAESKPQGAQEAQ